MTKSEFVSLVRSRLETDRSPNVYKRPVVRKALLERYIQAVYEQFYNEMYKSNPGDIWKYVIDIEEVITGDTDLSTGHTMPTIPVMLPRSNAGLLAFQGNTGSSYTVTDYKRLQSAVDAKYDTAYINGQYFVSVRGDKLYGNDTIDDGTTIIYSMIPKFTSFSDDDEVFIPGGMEDHFIDMVLDTIARPANIN